MAFKVGDRVKVVACIASPQDNGHVSTVAKLRTSALFPFRLADDPPSGENLFSSGELLLVPENRQHDTQASDLPGQVDTNSHDYMLGYADGYQVDALFLDADDLRRDFESESADRRAGFRAGVLRNLDYYRAIVLRDLDAAGI